MPSHCFIRLSSLTTTSTYTRHSFSLSNCLSSASQAERIHSRSQNLSFEEFYSVFIQMSEKATNPISLQTAQKHSAAAPSRVDDDTPSKDFFANIKAYNVYKKSWKDQWKALPSSTQGSQRHKPILSLSTMNTCAFSRNPPTFFHSRPLCAPF